MKPMRMLLVPALFVLIAIGVGVWLYPKLPAMAPTHWGAGGEANGWTPRFWAVAIWPLCIAAIAVLAPLLPAISPRRFEIRPFGDTWWTLVLAIEAFLLVVGTCAMLAAAGYPVSIPLVATLAVGAVLVVIGNYMGKLRKNFFVGIRTPWTLASDAVWERTHRFAGWLFVAAGVAWIIAGLLDAPPGWLIAIVLAAALVPCVYSFIVYRRLEGHPPSGGGAA